MNCDYINHNNYIESEPIVRTLKCNSILSHATYCNSAQFRFCKTVLASESYITCYAWPRPRFERVWKQSTKVNIRKALILGVVDSFWKKSYLQGTYAFEKKSGQQFCVQQKLPDPSDNIFDLIFFVCENQHWTVKDFQGRKKFSSIPHRFR